MTRDEAIKIQKRHTPTNVVDILADLGVLKLDETKSDRQKALDVLYCAHAKGENISTPWNIVTLLENAGLKIVEK